METQNPRHGPWTIRSERYGTDSAMTRVDLRGLGEASARRVEPRDRMRRKRNEAFYDVAIIGDDEAIDAVEAAEKYLKVVSADIHTRIP